MHYLESKIESKTLLILTYVIICIMAIGLFMFTLFLSLLMGKVIWCSNTLYETICTFGAGYFILIFTGLCVLLPGCLLLIGCVFNMIPFILNGYNKYVIIS